MRPRVLAFDIENKPISYNGEFPTAHITAIAACWADNPDFMHYWPVAWSNYRQALEAFRRLYDEADLVIGHYIRRHDLPIINGRMMTGGLAPLGDKLTSDTKLDWLKKSSVSASLENMLKYYGIEHTKAHVSVAEWESINEGDPRGLALLKARCTGDVAAQVALHKRLVELGHLSAPKIWRS